MKLFSKMKNVLNNNKGQSLVEYALILVLIAIVAIATMTTIGTQTNATFGSISDKLKNATP